MYENGVLTAGMQPKSAFVVDGHSEDDVARAMIDGKQKESFYVFNMDALFERIQHFKCMMPRVKIFYAMKTNDWDLILKLAISQGLGFDCASPGEISKVLKLGVSPLLLLRIRVDGDSQYKLGEKFGCDFDTEGFGLLEEAASLGLTVVGVAFHVGSGCRSSDSHAVGLQRARALFEHEARAGRRGRMRIVDIGGGFLSAATGCIDEVSIHINGALEKYFPDLSVQVIAEPGRYLADSSGTLYNSISNIRQITKDGKKISMIYVNDGLHGTLRYTEAWHTVEKFNRKPELNEEDAQQEEVILWGPTCDSTDRIMEHQTVRLPRCTPFDWLVFRTQGAYSYCFQGTFSCIKIPRMRAIISLALWNMVKNCPVFNSTDFTLNADISTPVSTVLPSVPTRKFNAEIHTSTLIEA